MNEYLKFEYTPNIRTLNKKSTSIRINRYRYYFSVTITSNFYYDMRKSLVTLDLLDMNDAGNDLRALSSEGDFTEDRNRPLSTTTVDNNVYQYPFENDRRYHAYCEELHYFLPNDEEEQNRLNQFHEIFRFTMRDSLHHAPLSSPQKILDVGTGTGVWAMEMADLYPSAEVIGADLSPIQPLWVPPNLQFLVADAEDLTLFGENKFDFIYIRCFAGCASNWNTFLERAFSLLRPGGFIECVEVEFDVRYERQSRNLDNDTHLTQFLRLIHEAAEKRNRTLNVASKLKFHLQATGFRDIKETVYNIPLHKESLDPRELQIGHDSLRCATNSIEAYGIRLFTRELKWSRIEALVLFAEVRNELRNSERQQFRPYTRLFVVHAKKP